MEAFLQNGGTLAFVGDAVMSLQVREYLVSKGYTQLKQLQQLTVQYVSAKAQAAFSKTILDSLNEEEMEVFKRGRNFKSHSVAKNANVVDYRQATGLEALWGYWHLTGQTERLNEMFERMIQYHLEGSNE